MLVSKMTTHLPSNVSKILRKARSDCGYTYLDVANLTGLSISTIVNAERKIPSPRTIKLLSTCYGIKVNLAHNTKGNVVYL